MNYLIFSKYPMTMNFVLQKMKETFPKEVLAPVLVEDFDINSFKRYQSLGTSMFLTEADLTQNSIQRNDQIVTYGLENGDYTAVEQMELIGRNQFAIQSREEKIADIAVKWFGDEITEVLVGLFALGQTLRINKSLLLQCFANLQKN